MKLLLLFIFLPFVSNAQLAPIYGIVQHGSEYYVKNYTANDSTLVEGTIQTALAAKLNAQDTSSLHNRLLLLLVALNRRVVIPQAGDGGTVTQTGNKSSAVTLDKQYGRITMASGNLTAASEVSFTLNNSFIEEGDVVIVNIQSVGTAGAYLVSVGSVSAGACTITLSNASAGALNQAVVLNFAVFKSRID